MLYKKQNSDEAVYLFILQFSSWHGSGKMCPDNPEECVFRMFKGSHFKI